MNVDQLKTGSHLSEISEDSQMMWFQVEPELSQVVSAGLVARHNIDGTGQYKPRI